MKEQRFYHPISKCLIYLREQADAHYWDKHWSLSPDVRKKLLAIGKNFVTEVTSKYLQPQDGPILEGGSGTGQNVAALRSQGYPVIGLDYAQTTVATLNQHVPELDIRLGDVRSTPFPDAHFAGYWSLGVIEHFWEGFLPIALEMKRIIQPEGYLFLTFPYMSPFRRLKVALGGFDPFRSPPDKNPPAHFYQFALDSRAVVKQFQSLGFDLVQKRGFAGLKGLKDEVPCLKNSLQRLYDYSGSSKWVTRLRYALDLLMSPLSGHSVLLVLKKK